MKRLFFLLMLPLVLSLVVISVASAADGDPILGCPPPFERHQAMDHDQDHEGTHRHIGSDTDRNGDGYICVKHIRDTKHLHIDNNVPIQQ